MRIAVVGGGPGGLYFAALMKGLDEGHEVTVWERNAPDDTFGFGVVFSDETLGSIEGADRVVHEQMESRFARWTDIDVTVTDATGTPQPFTVGGQGFAAMSRKELLRILQTRVADLGVTVHYRAEAPDPDELRASYDLVLAADGLNSVVRTKYADVFRPRLDRRHNKYIWFGTDLVFEAFQFFVKNTDWGTMQIHGYPYSDAGSTFIVEMHEDVWRRAGLDATEHQVFPPGVSDEYAVERIADIFRDELEGHRILTNNSKWLSFDTVRNERWHDGNVVLLGDAAHTAHFSIGSGTKLAMEDALALAACLHEHPTVDAALEAYQDERKPVVESTQRAAQASLEWFENIGMYADQDPAQFVFNLLTRSRRITFENLKDRDHEFAARMEAEFARHQGADRGRSGHVPADPHRRAGAEEPGHRLPDGHVLGRRRHGERVPPRPSRLEGARRCRPGDDRDDLRVAGRADHPRLHGAVERRAGSGVPAHHRVRPRPLRRQDRRPARPLGQEGLDPADVGGHGRAARRRQLGGHRTLGTSLRGGLPRAAGDDPCGHGRGRRRLRERSRACRRGRLRPGRASRGARLPAVLVPLAGLEPAHGRVRRITDEPAALPARGLRRRPGRCAGRHPGHRADLGDRLAARRATPTTTGSRSPVRSSRTVRPRSTCPPVR